MNPAGLIVQGIGMAMGIAEGRRNKLLLEMQGKTAAEQSVADADALSRDYRQLAGRQAASIAQGGGAYGGSAVKLLEQSERTAGLDRLLTLYKGQLRRIGLETEGETALRKSFLAGTQSLSSAGGSFMKMGG